MRLDIYSGTLVAFKTWWGQHWDGIICRRMPLVEIGLRWLPKIGGDQSPCPLLAYLINLDQSYEIDT